MDTLISNVTLVTMDEKMDVLFGAYLGVTDGKIAYIGKEPPKEKPQEEIRVRSENGKTAFTITLPIAE